MYLQAHTGEVVSGTELKTEVGMFLNLYPNGRGAMVGERSGRISLQALVTARLLSAHRAEATDLLFAAWYFSTLNMRKTEHSSRLTKLVSKWNPDSLRINTKC